MDESLSRKTLTALFDRLVAEGTIVYGPYTPIVINDGTGYPVEFRIASHLATKPHTITSPNPAFSHTAKYGPGSDLYLPSPELVIASLPLYDAQSCFSNAKTQSDDLSITNEPTHDLSLNLFSLDRPQFLLTTRNSYLRQHEPLTLADFAAALDVLKLWGGEEWYVIFNCGEKGGCSRVHKHLQGLKGRPWGWEALVREWESEPRQEREREREVSSEEGEEKGRGSGRVPFRFFLHRFKKGFSHITAEETHSVYTTLLEQTRTLLDSTNSSTAPSPSNDPDPLPDYTPHNIILWDDTLVIIPRRRGIWKGCSANAGGMLGSVWVPGREEVDEWEAAGCGEVLGALGVPA